MIVLRKTMNAAVEAERSRSHDLSLRFGAALHRVTALQQQLEAWLMNKSGDITPEQMAAMFWSQDDRWQAAFFNALPSVAQASWDARPPANPNEYRGILGVPAGEGQWAWMADHLDSDGRETIEAMHYHSTRKGDLDVRTS
jgi:hypothetical protein